MRLNSIAGTGIRSRPALFVCAFCPCGVGFDSDTDLAPLERAATAFAPDPDTEPADPWAVPRAEPCVKDGCPAGAEKGEGSLGSAQGDAEAAAGTAGSNARGSKGTPKSADARWAREVVFVATGEYRGRGDRARFTF